MRSFIAGATRRGAVQARKEVVSIESQIPAASFAIVFAEAGATSTRRRSAASARWPIGSCSGAGSPGKAPRIGSRSNSLDEHRRADDPLERRRADEALRGRRHHHADAVAAERRQPGELQCLVGGDAAADAEEDAGHRASPELPQ